MNAVWSRLVFGVVLAALVAVPAFAQVSDDPCRVVVRADDKLYFRPAQIEVPSRCEQLTVVFRHDGWLPKSATPRNWVLTKTTDANAVASDGYLAGKDAGWLKPDDARVIAHSAVIGRDESVQIVLDVDRLEAGTDYTYLCTIPGFSPVMRGTLKLQAQDSRN